MSQKLKSAAAFALACSGPAVAWGATLPGEANFTGPLVTPAVNALPAGMVNIQPYLIHTNTRGTYDNRGGRHESKPTVRQWQMAYTTLFRSFVSNSVCAGRTPTAPASCWDWRWRSACPPGATTASTPTR